MKRYNNLHKKVCDRDNIEMADLKARRCKPTNWGVIKHDRFKDFDNFILQQQLTNLTYKTSPYTTFKVFEPKERIIFRLPYYPDRITHHAIMNVTENIWTKTFIQQTYSCIKSRGIHQVVRDLRRALRKDPGKTVYCLKLDITKFYPSINHDILKAIIRRKIKDKKLLVLLDEIIDSADGVPIGNYLSQFFANLYLAYFDHWIKEEVGIKYYYRYADDIVILGDNKQYLHNLLIAIKMYLSLNLKLKVKPNYQVFPVDSRGIDFVGYRFYHTHTLLRKSIKKKMMKAVSLFKQKEIDIKDLANKMNSYFGWLKYCDSKHLLRKIEEETGLSYSNWNGEYKGISNFYRKTVYIIELVTHKKYFEIHCIYNKRPYTLISRNRRLFKTILDRNQFPLVFKLLPYYGRRKNKDKCETKQSRIFRERSLVL